MLAPAFAPFLVDSYSELLDRVVSRCRPTTTTRPRPALPPPPAARSPRPRRPRTTPAAAATRRARGPRPALDTTRGAPRRSRVSGGARAAVRWSEWGGGQQQAFPAACPVRVRSSCLTARCLPACSCSSCLSQAVGEDEHGQRVKRQLGQRGGGGQQGTPRRAPPAPHARPHDACWLSHTTTRGALFFLMRAPSSCYFALVAVLGLAALPSFFFALGAAVGAAVGSSCSAAGRLLPRAQARG